jgi:hypothetical protein
MSPKSSRPSMASNPRLFLERKLVSLIRSTVTGTCKRCLDSNLAFRESVRSRKGFVSTCEVLETILIPMLDFNDDFLPKVKSERHALENELNKALSVIVDRVKESFDQNRPLCPGDPYVNSSGSTMRAGSTGLPYIEANAFFVSVVLHLLLTIDDFRELPAQIDKSQLRNLAIKAIDQIIENFVDEKGWSYSTKDHEVNIYFTWSVVETLIEVLDSKEQCDLIVTADRETRLKECLAQVRAFLEVLLFGVPGKTQPFLFVPKKIENERQNVYHALQAFITLGLLESERYLDMAQTLVTLVANSHVIVAQKDYEVGYPLEDKGTFGTAVLGDSSILPLVVRSIATVFGEYPDPNFFLFTEKSRLRDPWSYLIMADRIEELRANQGSDHLWGAEAGDYEIYYTERVVEALMSCYHYVISPHKSVRRLELPNTDLPNLQEFNADLRDTGRQKEMG